MNVITYFLGVYLNTINIPDGFQPTSPNRDRLIAPDFSKIFQGFFSYWIIPLAAIPALLTVILLFIESEVALLECYKVNMVSSDNVTSRHRDFVAFDCQPTEINVCNKLCIIIYTLYTDVTTKLNYYVIVRACEL